jgi:L-serine dehydratase
MAAVNAMTTANMALAGVDAVISLDEVIIALDKTGRSLPFEIRCTGYGGLCMTPTASLLEEKMKRANI